MFSIVNIIKNIPFDFFVQNNFVYYQKKNIIIKCGSNNEKSTIAIDIDSPFVIEKMDSSFLYIRTWEEIIRFDYNKKSYETNSFKNFNNKQIRFINEEFFIVSEEINEEKEEWELSKITFNDDILWKIPFDNAYKLTFINNETIIISNNSFIYCIGNSNVYLWQHSFSDLLTGENIEKVGEIIVDKNILYLCLKDNKNRENNATFAIDAMTGNILNIYKGFYGRLQLQNDVLYEAFYYHVNKLDLQSGVITKYDFEETLKPLNLIINYEKSIIDGDKLYFVSGLIATNKIAILDLTKNKIIWETILEIEDSNSFIVEMRLLEDKLYVSCSDHTLYIFEKEK